MLTRQIDWTPLPSTLTSCQSEWKNYKKDKIETMIEDLTVNDFSGN